MSRVITVCGSVEAAQCGLVLPHEHLFIDLRNQSAPGASDAPVTPADRPKLMCDPYCMRDNLLVADFDAAASECRDLKKCGCDTVVDCSSTRIGRDPEALKRLAVQEKMNIVMGCSWYTADTHPAEVAEKSAEELAESLISEIENGIDGIRPGIIGEVGTGKEILPGEKKALAAAAIAQKATGLAVSVHIYPWSSNGLEVVKQLTAAGVAPDRIVICHSDVEPDRRYIWELLKSGVYVELDNFGKEFTPKAGGFAAGAFVRDSERVKLAAQIIDDGFGSQLLLTNDICLKCMLHCAGGDGYDHIFRHILPQLAAAGIPEQYLRETVMRKNPLRMLAIA